MVLKKQRLVPVLYLLTALTSVIIAIIAIVIITKSHTNTVKDFQIIALSNALVILFILPIPHYLFKLNNYIMPSLLHIYYILFIWASLIVGEIIGIYRITRFYDIVIHMIGGYLIALFAVYLVNTLKKENTSSFVILFVISFTQALAVLWELFEFGIDTLVGSNMQSYFDDINQIMFTGQLALRDTMLDLMFNILGMIVCIFTYKFYKKSLMFLKRGCNEIK